jgi:glycosyltransferase involved in cell wall biosynthesis
MSKLLTIITITYNDLAGLKYTLNSVGNNLDKIEYLIIDGNSTDGTKELLNSLSDHYNWVSEKDDGLYDAMNKGQAMAMGEYLIFMNSGDGFYTQETLKKVLSILETDEPDVLYGETMYRDDKNNELGIRSKLTTRKLPENLHWKKLLNGMLVCHQSFIVKRKITVPYLQHNLSADIDWMITCLKKSNLIINANMIVANYLVGGISTQQHSKSLVDRFKVLVAHFGLLKTLGAHFYIALRHVKHRFTSSPS